MKQSLTFILFFWSCLVHAQDFPYPKLPATGNLLNDFIQANWFLKNSAAGDLNGDKLPDLAFVMEYKDTVRERRPDGMINKGSPRILVVLIKNAVTGRYDLFLQNNTFIIRYGEGGMDPEAYGEVSITKGVLQIFVSFLRGNATYKFRMQNGDLYLIGGSTGGVSGGWIYSFDANFNTRKAVIEEGRMEDEKMDTRWVALPKTSLKKLRDMKMIFEWEVVKGKFL